MLVEGQLKTSHSVIMADNDRLSEGVSECSLTIT